MKKVIIAIILLVIFSQVKAQAPAQWDTVKTQLTLKLDEINTEILNRWDNQQYCTNFASNLLLADSNRGYKLFTHDPINYPFPIPAYQSILYAYIDTMLMAFDTLGLKAVDLTIQYPMLVSSFPNSQYYLDFYVTVAQKIKQKGFKLIIGCQAAFVDSVFGESNMVADITKHYFNPDNNIVTDDTLDILRFKQEKLQMIQTIIDSLQPDYLTMEMEPQTQENNLFHLIDYSVQNTVSFINYYISNLSNPNGVKLGAGSGSWDDINFIEEIVNTNIDYIDYHVYPVNFNCVNDIAFIIDSLADIHNKELIIGESWCFKATDYEMTNITDLASLWATIFSRDVFDYWVDIDTSFVKSMILLSQQSKIEIVNFFWANVLFGQLSYDPAIHGSMTSGQILNVGQQYGYQNMFQFILSPIGQYAKTEIAKICENSDGSNDIYKDESIILYPNPSKTSIYIKGTALLDADYIILYDLSGRIVEQRPVNKAITEINISNYSKGIYLLKISGLKYNSLHKIIKE